MNTDGKKAHLNNKCYKIGRIRYNSWATKVLKACDIVIYERELVHIEKHHGKELNKIGLSVFDYAKFVIRNFNSVYQGHSNCKIIVHKTKTKYSFQAVIELEFKDNQYKIKTATPIKTERLLKMKLLCANFPLC